MRVNVARLRGRIATQNLTQEGVAKLIGIDRGTFSRKMNRNALSFTVEEMHKLCEVLKLTNEEAVEIFLSR